MVVPDSDTPPVAVNLLLKETLPLISAFCAVRVVFLGLSNTPLLQSRSPPIMAPASDTRPVALNPSRKKTEPST